MKTNILAIFFNCNKRQALSIIISNVFYSHSLKIRKNLWILTRAVLAFLFFFAGEEISWRQRISGIGQESELHALPVAWFFPWYVWTLPEIREQMCP